MATAWLALWIVCFAFPTKAVRVVTFSLIATLFVASVAVSQLTGCAILWGPWNMFHNQAGYTDMNGVGCFVGVLGCLVGAALFFFRGGLESVNARFASKQPSASLALVRILLPIAMLLNSHQFQAMVLHGHGLPSPWLAVVPAVSAINIVLGVQAQLSCIVLGACCTLTMGERRFWHHNWNCIMMLLCVLAFTPCGSLFSLHSLLAYLRSDGAHGDWPGRQEGTINEPDGGLQCSEAVDGGAKDDIKSDTQGDKAVTKESTWAKPLIALHFGLIYFWAGCDKFHWGWINGVALRHTIHTRSSIRNVFDLLFPRKDVQLLLCALLTVGCICLELTAPFFFWSKRFHVHAVAVCFSMHVGMSFMCGNLGAYTMVAWLCLISILDDELVNTYLRDVRNFTIAALSMLLLMTWAHQVEVGRFMASAHPVFF